MRMPDAETPKLPPAPKAGTLCSCGEPLVDYELLLRHAPGEFKRIAVFKRCMKCCWTSTWIKFTGRTIVETALWNKLRALQNFTVEFDDFGILLPWISEMMYQTETGREVLRKNGLAYGELVLGKPSAPVVSAPAPAASEGEAVIEQEPFLSGLAD